VAFALGAWPLAQWGRHRGNGRWGLISRRTGAVAVLYFNSYPALALPFLLVGRWWPACVLRPPARWLNIRGGAGPAPVILGLLT